MRPLAIAAALLAPGCHLVFDLDRAAPRDAPDTGDGGLGCFGRNGPDAERRGLLEVCLTGPVPRTRVLPEVLDTDADCAQLAELTPGVACVVAAETLVISSPVRALGARPLVLLATRDLVIEAELDVSSTHDRPGAGAKDDSDPLAKCAAAVSSGRAGGAGGSFATAGAHGGAGGGGASPGAPAPPAGPAVRAGCPGTSGDIAGAGAGGFGGGVVYMIAGRSIDLRAVIRAGGAPGRGGQGLDPNGGGGGGGGGGGAGGFAALDAPSITMDRAMWGDVAGGGGGGGGCSIGAAGSDGDGPRGGAGSELAPPGGRGGDGAIVISDPLLEATPGLPGLATCGTNGVQGGGGGGGGAGYACQFSSTGAWCFPGRAR